MNRFIIDRNIRRYRNLLEGEADEARRRMVLDLLAEEEAKLAELTEKQMEAVPRRVQQSD
jgi:hypothetical protein